MNLASRGRLPSLADDTATDALEHGMGMDDASSDAVESLEDSADGLGGQGTLASFCGSYDYASDKDSWEGPFWKGNRGSGTFLETKKNDIVYTFGDTARTWMTMYSITDHNHSASTENYYDPVINGNYDQQYIDFANDLINNGMEDTILRPNPEHNLSNLPRYPSNADGSNISDPNVAGQKYADAFAHVVSVMMNVSGAQFDWLYSPIGNYAGGSIADGDHADDDIVAKAWPLNSNEWPAGVDAPIICPSFYDTTSDGGMSCTQWKNSTDSEKRQAAIDHWNNSQKAELDSYTNWAKNDVNARLGLVEWGPRDGTSSDCAGDARGDNPWFMDLTINYCRNEGYVFQHPWGYFHANDTNSILWRNGAPYDMPDSTDAWTYQKLNGEGKYILTNP